MRDDGRRRSCRDRCCRLEWSSGDMLKAGPPDVAGRPEGPGVPEVCGLPGGGGAPQQSSSSPCLPAWLSLCLFCLTAPLHSVPL